MNVRTTNLYESVNLHNSLQDEIKWCDRANLRLCTARLEMHLPFGRFYYLCIQIDTFTFKKWQQQKRS